MNMFQNYFQQKQRAANLSSVQVTEDEFIRRLIEQGNPPEKAQQTAKVTKMLGSQVEINNEMVGIVDD